MVSCASCGCTMTEKTKKEGITFHSFPKDCHRRTLWIKFVRKPDWLPKPSSVLCSCHFAQDSFDRTSNLRIRLLATAVPTVEVDRLKYVRLYNPMVLKPLCVENIPRNTPDPALESRIAVPGPSHFRLPSPIPNVSSTVTVNLPDTPRKKALKRKLREEQQINMLQSKKIRKLQNLALRRKKQVLSLRSLVKQLKQKHLLLEQQENVLLDHFGKNNELIKRLFQKSQNKSVKQMYEHSVRTFAVTLHFFSPKAYNYVRKSFNNCLPHPKTLSKWYASVDAKPGFTSEALEFLRVKVVNSEKKLLCSLVFDEMSIRKHVEFAGDKYYGYVDCGNGLSGDSVDIAKEVLVFMLVCINEAWKIPIGYFFMAGINSEQKESLVKQALTLLTNVGITITNITFDGTSTNFSMCSLLGNTLNKNNITAHFQFNDNLYFLLPDPPHMIKLVRNCFAHRKRFINCDGKVVDFTYLIKLNELQETEGLHLGNKLRKRHIQFFKQKMKVRLATQLLSRSVSDSLLYCTNKLKLKEFNNCTATSEFILLMNDAFDILNSHKVSDFGYKQAACSYNINNIKAFYLKFYKYVLGLKLIDGQPVLDSKRKSGFFGLLMGLKVVLGLYEKYVETSIIKFIPTYKINQDHIELFFGAIRSQGGYNNNPTCRQFTAAYKKILIHAEVRDGGAGNCVPLEDINILNVTSKNKVPEQIINESVTRRIDLNEHEPLTDLLNDHNYAFQMDNEHLTNLLNDHNYAFEMDSLSSYSLEVVTYIAGFVSFRLGKILQCENCISELYGVKENFLNSLIYQKSRKALSYPSYDVIHICLKCEKFLREEKIKHGNKINKQVVYIQVLEYFSHQNLFENMQPHDVTPLESHKILLIKSICHQYLNTRLHFICRNALNEISIRNICTKLILFKGQ